jgi:hypothetical protein
VTTPRPKDGELIWVRAPGATYGLVVKDGRVVEAAPIASRFVGQDERAVAEYLRHRGATFKRIGR